MNKSDLRVRPIYHRLRNRIEGHICICFTAYAVLLEFERILKATGSPLTLARVREAVKTMYRLNYVSPQHAQADVRTAPDGCRAKADLRPHLPARIESGCLIDENRKKERCTAVYQTQKVDCVPRARSRLAALGVNNRSKSLPKQSRLSLCRSLGSGCGLSTFRIFFMTLQKYHNL